MESTANLYLIYVSTDILFKNQYLAYIPVTFFVWSF